MALAPGTELGHYEIEASLGQGAMGEVYRARDRRLGRAVAVKVLSSAFASDPERLRRFEQEALAASALSHPNIVHVYDVGRAEPDVHYIVMELVEGRTLRRALEDAPFAPPRLAKLGRQIAEGLAKAHAGGIVHRDLKPENVMVTEDDVVKILDFGLAKLVSLPFEMRSDMATMARGATRHGMLIGTVEYMSPEQAAGRAVDYRSDQFSLGLLLYEMATGELAFQRETAAQTLASIIESEPASISEVNPTAPAALAAIVSRCLRKRPEGRYDDTRELVRALESLEHEPVKTSAAPHHRTPGSSVYYVRGDDGEERALPEARLRRELQRGRYSGVEMVRREAEEGWHPLFESELFEEALERRDRSARHRLHGFARHAVSFVAVGTGFTVATGDVPNWLAFWGIGLAIHAFNTLPAFASLWNKRVRPEAARVSAAPELPSGSFRDEVERVRALLTRRGGEDLEGLLTEIDRIVERVCQVVTLRGDLEAQTSPAERDRLKAAEDEARAALARATSTQDGKLHERHLGVIVQRRRAIDKALEVVQRLRVREEMAEHQVKQLRLDLSRGEASSASAPELTSRLQDIRHEVDAIEKVDEAIARELSS